LTFKKVVRVGSNGFDQFEEFLDLLAQFFGGQVDGLPAEVSAELDLLSLIDPALDIFLVSLFDVRDHKYHAIFGLNATKDLSRLLEGLIGEVGEAGGSLKHQDGINLVWGLEGADCALVLIEIDDLKVPSTTDQLLHDHLADLVVCVSTSGVPKTDGINHLHGVVNLIVQVINVELVCTDLRRS
jgi:hypothetical protein